MFFSKTAILAALATISAGAGAQQSSGKFTVSNFVAKHAVESDYELVSFDLAYDYPGDKPAHCVASAKSPKKNGLTEFEFMPCETGYKQWSLTRGGPNGQWVFEAINVDVQANYTFAPNAQSSYTYPGALGGPKGTYQQLMAPGGTFQTESV